MCYHVVQGTRLFRAHLFGAKVTRSFGAQAGITLRIIETRKCAHGPTHDCIRNQTNEAQDRS